VRFFFGTKYDRWVNEIKSITLKNTSTMKHKPLKDRVLVEPMEAEEKTASGIIIPDSAKEKPQKGKVIAVGDGKKDEPMTVKEGDTVIYGKFSGTEITIDGKDYLIMREDDILLKE
jgi:chaperonin GroES